MDGLRESHGSAPQQAPAATVANPAALRLQVLSTEHWSLLASRALAWNESFSRAGMFLSTLSGAIVALALVAQSTAFGSAFAVFALVILPVVLFVGVATFVRIGGSNYHDTLCVMGMNRIRGAYLELAPDLEPYFVMSSHDDLAGMYVTMGIPPGTNQLAHFLAASPTLVGVLNSVIVGVIAVLIAQQVTETSVALLVLVGVATAVVALGLHAIYAGRTVVHQHRLLEARFPTPPPHT